MLWNLKMRSVWRLWFVPGKSENPLISQEDFIEVRDLVGVVTLEKKKSKNVNSSCLFKYSSKLSQYGGNTLMLSEANKAASKGFGGFFFFCHVQEVIALAT